MGKSLTHLIYWVCCVIRFNKMPYLSTDIPEHKFISCMAKHNKHNLLVSWFLVVYREFGRNWFNGSLRYVYMSVMERVDSFDLLPKF